MNIITFFNKFNLEKTLLIGYYGGTNFGDELLLEIIQVALFKHNIRDVTIRYSNLSIFSTYHNEYDYKVIDPSATSLIKAIFGNKNITVGGGGFWGLDFNTNTFLMGLILFFSRFILFKKIYLIGVGYYNSASLFARVGAWFAGTSANVVIVRDQESFNNFKKTLFATRKKLYLDDDIAMYSNRILDDEILSQNYKLNPTLDDVFREGGKFIALRRFHNEDLYKKFIELVKEHATDDITYLTFENIDLFREDYKKIFSDLGLQENQVINFDYNPVLLYYAFKKYGKHLHIFAPQFHVIMIAYLAGVNFEPIAYDNKVTELLKKIGYDENQIVKIY